MDISRILSLFLAGMFVFLLCACSPERLVVTDMAGQDAYYRAVQQLKSGKTDIDYMAMRYGFLRTPEYQDSLSPAYQTIKKQIYQAIEQQDFTGCIKQADSLLDKNYTDLNLHFVTFFCASMLKDKPKYEMHMKTIEGLLASIQVKGAGRTTQSHLTVMDENELSGFVSVVYGSHLDDATILKKDNAYSAQIWTPLYLKHKKQYIYFKYLAQNK